MPGFQGNITGSFLCELVHTILQALIVKIA